jgi:hypothetical protein
MKRPVLVISLSRDTVSAPTVSISALTIGSQNSRIQVVGTSEYSRSFLDYRGIELNVPHLESPMSSSGKQSMLYNLVERLLASKVCYTIS